MQWLSRIYGGRGGYSSEELYKIVTGKTADVYFIFPFVKNAPPEVNRILERVYRRHREQGDTKVASAIAAWTTVRRAGYVKITKSVPIWVKRSTNMEQMKIVTNYGIAVTAARMLGKGLVTSGKVVKRHPKIVRGAGLVGLGIIGQKELEKRRKRKQGYAILDHFTPDIPEPRGFKPLMKKGLQRGSKIGGRIAKAGTTSASVFVLAMMIDRILDSLSEKRAYMPTIRPDVELGRFELATLGKIEQYAGVMPSKLLQGLKTKSVAALHKTKTGVERGLLAWLLGFISAELLSRGITAPRKRQEVTFPQKFAMRGRIKETGERLPGGFQPLTKNVVEPLPKFKRKRKLGRKIGLVAALPVAALIALRRRRLAQEGYSFGTAARKVGRFAGRLRGPASKIGRGLGTTANVGITALILSEFLPKKKKKQLQTQPPVRPYARLPFSPAALAARLKKAKVLRGMRTITATQRKKAAKKIPADLAKWKILPMRKPPTKFHRVKMYPMKSQAQRRFLHATDPKLAKEFEEKTPEGKKLPEKVSQHALQVPWAAKRLRDLLRLKGAGRQGKEISQWARNIARTLRTSQIKATSAKTKQIISSRAGQWETIANQVEDALGRAQLEKIGLLTSAGIATVGAGVAGREFGEKRERERIRKAVG